MRKTSREINDAIIDEVLITGTANIASADLKIIKGIAAEYVQDIFRRLREHGYDDSTVMLYNIPRKFCQGFEYAKCFSEIIFVWLLSMKNFFNIENPPVGDVLHDRRDVFVSIRRYV